MNKQELIEKLLEYKQHNSYEWSDCEAIIWDIMSDLCDYDSDNDYELDEFTYRFETIDWVEEFLKHTIETCGILTLKNRLSDLHSDWDWFLIDDVDWTIYNPEGSDVEEWIDDILYELWYDEADVAESNLASKDLQDETE
jgi:hypothetical protein